MIKAVIFDCFGVLTGDTWKEFVASLPDDQKEPARELNRALDSGFMSQADFSQQIHQLTGTAPERVEEVINAEMFKNTPLLELIKTLKPNYKIGLLSNVSSDWIQNSFLTKDEVVLFDEIVLSHEVGMVKPDHRIFELTADRMGIDTSECVFVDDSQFNCEAAHAVGMRAVQYEDFQQLKTELATILNHV